MKITHPFVVLVVGGGLLTGAAWWRSQAGKTTPSSAGTSPATGEPAIEAKPRSPLPQRDATPLKTQPAPDRDVKSSGSPKGTAEQELSSEPWELGVKEIIAERLKDPDSALFRELKSNGPGQVCGQVNAKNSLGGYVGYKWFWIKGLEDPNPAVVIDADAPLAGIICDPKHN